MILVNEIIRLPAILFFIFVVVTESVILLYIQISYKKGYKSLFEPTEEIAKKKASIASSKFNDIIRNGIYTYYGDLKLIGKHMSQLNIDDDTNSINKNSKFYKNYQESKNKNIIFSDFSNFSSTDYLQKYIDTNNKKLNYIDKYEEEFEEINDPNYIIKTLLDNENHKELNTISYYKINGDINSLNDSSKISANYLISILKTIYIKRYLTKRKEIDYVHINLLLKDELYVFPPDLYNNTYMHYFPQFANTTCDYENGNYSQKFPICIYNYIKSESNKLISFSPQAAFNEPFYLNTYINFNIVIMNFCMTITFVKKPDFINHSHLPHICLEINLTKLLSAADFESKEKIHIGAFSRYQNILIPVYYSNSNTYELIKEVYTDKKFGKYQINSKNSHYFSLFHFLYLDIFANESCYTHDSISMNDLFKEYQTIYDEFYNSTINTLTFEHINHDFSPKMFEIEKTVCRYNLYDENITISKDKYVIIITPLTCKFGFLDDNFFEIKKYIVNYPMLYSYTIISTNPQYTEEKIQNIVQIKILRLCCFIFLSTIILLLVAVILLRVFTEYKFEPINTLIKLSENMEEYCSSNKLKLENIKVLMNNIEQNSKEVLVLKDIFQNMFKTLLLKKIIEEKKIINLDEKNNDEKNNIIIQNLYDMIQNMNNVETKNVCKWIISHYHYNNGYFKLAEEELKSLMVDINNKESSLNSKNDIYDSQLKDKIGRFNKMAFLNEYTPLKINETLLPIIKNKLIKQKVKYLLGLSKFYQGVIFNNNLINTKKNITKNKNNTKNNNYDKYYEAIECFNECKEISKLLGMNPIKQIYSHIMIAQCYIRMKKYKESMINLNEALILYLELQKIFKDEETVLFSPRVMLYVETAIFQTIMYNIVQAVRISSKENACAWIILKIFETSPFIFPNIHLECSNIIQNCLKYPDKNNRYKDKYKKIFNKISARLITRKNNSKNISNNNELRTNISSLSGSNPSSSVKAYMPNIRSSSRSIDFTTLKGSYISHRKENDFLNKVVMLCVSERIVHKLNGMEIKDVIIKFFQKCFINNDNDKFGFIQFSNNGKKTINIKPQRLDTFLQKFESNKNAFQSSETINYKSDTMFTEFYNLFDSIIKQQSSKCDNIIIMFINAEDIRFRNIKECVDIVNALNEKNYTVILLSNDLEISKEKVLSINSFIFGLYDGYFIHINNYQRIKQIFINIATTNKSDKFVNYDYEFLENIL